MGGFNLELFKVRIDSHSLEMTAQPTNNVLSSLQFGTYIMFPIGFMYYFGTNLDNRFTVHDFWPKPEECNKLPRNREEVEAEYKRLVERQKMKQARKEEQERRGNDSQ